MDARVKLDTTTLRKKEGRGERRKKKANTPFLTFNRSSNGSYSSESVVV
jgi:hypothetical protein